MSKAAEKHEKLRKQNRNEIAGLYMFVGILLLSLLITVVSLFIGD